MRKTFLVTGFLILLFSCNERNGAPLEKGVPKIEKLAFDYRKYGVKSGLIVFATNMKTKSIDLTYKSIVYFDHYGMVERKDTYDNGELQQTILSDGTNNYNISHTNKTVVRTGQAYRGTESKFGWDDISQEDLRLGRVKKLPPKMIAGKKCKAYEVQTGAATATFAGWENILLFSQIQSEGGKSVTQARIVRTVPINPVIFLLPQGYKVKG